MKNTRMIETISIRKIKPIVPINFKHDDIDKISKSVKEIDNEPFIVRLKDKNYQLCFNLEILESIKKLGYKNIDCIIKNITKQHGKELCITSLLIIKLANPYKTASHFFLTDYKNIIGCDKI
jgi:hypothetical protein